MTKSKFIQMAIDEAWKSDHRHFKHGAILVSGKCVISLGHNQPIRNHFCFKSVHAEMQTILEAKRKKVNLKNCHLYVVRLSNTGETLLSKPCQICMNILRNNKVKHVIYSLDNNKYDLIYLN